MPHIEANIDFLLFVSIMNEQFTNACVNFNVYCPCNFHTKLT
jgi:hypothetical protein